MNEDLKSIEERAEQLVDAHFRLLEDLVNLRKKRGLSQAVVGERMGVSQPSIASFEAYDSNPTLSTIRRYALAVGARLHIEVVDDVELIQIAKAGITQVEAWLAQKPAISLEIKFGPAVISND